MVGSGPSLVAFDSGNGSVTCTSTLGKVAVGNAAFTGATLKFLSVTKVYVHAWRVVPFERVDTDVSSSDGFTKDGADVWFNSIGSTGEGLDTASGITNGGPFFTIGRPGNSEFGDVSIDLAAA